MLKRITFLLRYYAFFVLFFVLQKPLFMVFQHDKLTGVTFADWFRVMGHGLPLDFSTAGYITVLPALLILLSVWATLPVIQRILNIYTIFIGVLVCLIFTVDVELYHYWQFRIDATPLFYLKTPSNALASVTVGTFVRQIAFLLVYTAVFILIYRKWLWKKILAFSSVKWYVFPVFLLLAAFLFVPIRGGFSAATMNVGWVYFSGSNVFLNHAAINPAWNMLASVLEGERFDKQYRFMSDEKAKNLVTPMLDFGNSDDFPHVLNTNRPNIILVVMESFSANAIVPLGGEPDIAPNLSHLSEEGILFTNFYANGNRTDKGLTSILSAYPTQAKTCVIKYPVKTDKMPHLGKSLKAVGYHLDFYYGGDGDFTNMRSYMKNAGFERFVSSEDFPKKDFVSSWGVPDGLVFNRMMSDLKNTKQPFFNVLLTLTSHEPFAIPVPPHFKGKDGDDLYKSAVHYTDSCIGAFVEEAKKQDWWKNTLLIFVSDHSYTFPATMTHYIPRRYQIPMIWMGGAVKIPMKADVIGSQNDIAATLLAQMGIDHSGFRFSKNLFDPQSPHYAVYMLNNDFGIVEKDGFCVFDCDANRILLSQGGGYADKGKAYIQTVYDDLSQR